MKTEKNQVSIIIPCRYIDSLTEKCIKECLNLDYDNFEIIVLPDSSQDSHIKNKKLRIIETGKVLPAVKRNIAMKKARGEFLAFIDSDAYPDKKWLKNAINYFEEDIKKEIGIVGGPNLTPKESNFAEHVSGYVLSNFLVSGPACVRYKVTKNQYVKELPSCNYISRKKISPEYKPDILTAEDSKFCFDISKKGYKILYAGDVVVFHHRRDKLSGHVKQMYNYGRDIAWLTKDEFSPDKLFFSLLSLFVIGFIVGILSLTFSWFPINILFLIFLVFYVFIMILTSVHKDFKTTDYVFILSIATHFAYGVGWIVGIFSKRKSVLNKR